MNKKDVIIIGTYPNQPHKVDMLRDCIDRVRPLGYDILVVSHFPLPTDIQESVEYVIYDKENVMMVNSCPDYWFGADGFVVMGIIVRGVMRYRLLRILIMGLTM